MTGSCQGQVSGGVGTRLQGKARTCFVIFSLFTRALSSVYVQSSSGLLAPLQSVKTKSHVIPGPAESW